MRSLSKPIKITPNKVTPANTGKKQGVQKQNKKITKTIFHSPFRYKILSLSHDDNFTLISLLTPYIQKLRSQQPIKIKNIHNQQFISFKPKQKHENPVLIHPDLICGIKGNLKAIKQSEKQKIIILFYEQTKHDHLEKLLCNIIYHKIPYIVTHNIPEIAHLLGVKTLTALGLRDSYASVQLQQLCSKCLIQIPWLVNYQWIPVSGGMK